MAAAWAWSGRPTLPAFKPAVHSARDWTLRRIYPSECFAVIHFLVVDFRGAGSCTLADVKPTSED